MTETSDNGNAKNGAGEGEPSVLGSLPSTRPNRLGRRREGNGGPAAKPAAPRRKAATTTAARPKAASAKAPSGARAKPQSGSRSKPQSSARTRPDSAVRMKPVTDRSAKGGPRAVREGAPSLGAPPPNAKREPDASYTPSGTELVTTVVQAAGELAQIGLTVGGQILKRAVERLPHP